MSTRCYLLSITSIDPIREAVASGDASLADAVINHYTKRRLAEALAEALEDEDIGDILQDFRKLVKSMIMCTSPPKKEPGGWNEVIEVLAEHFKLKPNRNFLFNEGWKHYQVWEPYRALVASYITAPSDQSLTHLQNGRPLKGARIDHDGSLFAWLTPDEVKELFQALSRVDKTIFRDEDFVGFHEALLKSLKAISRRNAVLFLYAC